jgi:hypothetical protein
VRASLISSRIHTCVRKDYQKVLKAVPARVRGVFFILIYMRAGVILKD